MNVDFPETLCRNPRMDAVRNHLARNGQLVHPGPCVFFEFACDPGQIPWILETPLAAWLAKGNPLGPEKRKLRRGFPQSGRAFCDPEKNVKPAFLGKVPVKSHPLGADKTHFEPMPAVRERRVHRQTGRQKNRVGTGRKCTRPATRKFQKIKS